MTDAYSGLRVNSLYTKRPSEENANKTDFNQTDFDKMVLDFIKKEKPLYPEFYPLSGEKENKEDNEKSSKKNSQSFKKLDQIKQNLITYSGYHPCLNQLQTALIHADERLIKDGKTDGSLKEYEEKNLKKICSNVIVTNMIQQQLINKTMEEMGKNPLGEDEDS